MTVATPSVPEETEVRRDVDITVVGVSDVVVEGSFSFVADNSCLEDGESLDRAAADD
jgi:hypothetical protein